MPVLFNDVEMDQKQPGIQKFEIYAVTIKKSMTEYHH